MLELPVRTWRQTVDKAVRTFDVRLAVSGIAILACTAVTIPFLKQALREAILVLRDTLMLRES
ncbi:MAG TPA: hypothetical protein DIS98_06540 [Colwellia sp.]|nr:hypothetical protein [Colwellia sp.]